MFHFTVDFADYDMVADTGKATTSRCNFKTTSLHKKKNKK